MYLNMKGGKCRVCKQRVTSQSIKDNIGVVLPLDNINHYFCSHEHCKIFMQKRKEAKIETQWLDKINNIVKDLFGYSEKQILPRMFFTRISDLRNGTERFYVKNIKNGEKSGYDYEIIYNTFVKNKDYIKHIFNTKVFDKESKKINYMMEIIEGDINNVYINHMLKYVQEIREKQQENIGYIDVAIINSQQDKTNEDVDKSINNKKNDLSSFFDGDI